MKDNQKKGKIQEVGGYDDPSLQKTNRLNIVKGLNEGGSMVVHGLEKISKILDSILEEEDLKKELIPVIQSLTEKAEGDLTKIFETINNYYQANLSNPTKFDVMKHNLDRDMPTRGTSLNEGKPEKEETIFEWKVNRNINRINQIMDKIK